ncbi:hypothetical protein O6H91_23G058400 [Diphasiastrum complanatum]|uniref:Uncharacterized protein n=1 Tax=Diphasiastrum complanatum TaxID=34168 RepID=A0ACC2AD06_DIPCM|nr:hypothetical protein O6H91_23G058400 [Diphasiastrum complanatum]
MVDCVISREESSINVKGRGVLSHFARFVYGSIVKPFQALQHMMGPKKAKPTEISHHSFGKVLRNFKEVQNLRIELLGGELGIEEGFLLKWKAEFGSTLESCVILGASSVAKVDIEGQGVSSVSRGWKLMCKPNQREPASLRNPMKQSLRICKSTMLASQSPFTLMVV